MICHLDQTKRSLLKVYKWSSILLGPWENMIYLKFTGYAMNFWWRSKYFLYLCIEIIIIKKIQIKHFHKAKNPIAKKKPKARKRSGELSTKHCRFSQTSLVHCSAQNAKYDWLRKYFLSKSVSHKRWPTTVNIRNIINPLPWR